MTREQLEARATELKIKFQKNWRDETLAEKIKEAEDAEEASQANGSDTLIGGNGDAAASGDNSGGDGTSNAGDGDAGTSDESGNDQSGDAGSKSKKLQDTIQGLREAPVAIVTCAVAGGRRRAGRRWPGGATEVPMDEMTDELAAELQSDPMFQVMVSVAKPDPE